MQLRSALRDPGLLLGFGQRREQQRGQNRDDRDDDQKFDERETRAVRPGERSSACRCACISKAVFRFLFYPTL